MRKEKVDILYDCALWLFNIMLDVFFREIRPRGSHKIPLEGPLIFVAAPHANQVTCLFEFTIVTSQLGLTTYLHL